MPAIAVNWAAFFVPRQLGLARSSTPGYEIWPLWALVFGIASKAVLVGAGAQRLQDVGRSGWVSVLLIVPRLCYAVELALLIWPAARRHA